MSKSAKQRRPFANVANRIMKAMMAGSVLASRLTRIRTKQQDALKKVSVVRVDLYCSSELGW